MSKLLFCVLLASTAIVSVSGGRCEKDVEKMYKEDEALIEATGKMTEAYQASCQEAKTCEFSDYEETLEEFTDIFEEAGASPDSLPTNTSSLSDLDVNAIQTLANQLQGEVDSQKLEELLKARSPSLGLTATMEFSSFVKSDPTYVDYVAKCSKADAKVTNVDVVFMAQGNTVFANLLKSLTSTGIQMDIDVTMKTLPVCMPSSCDGEEDLDDVVDEVIKTHFSNDEAVEDLLNNQLPDGIPGDVVQNALSPKSFCAIGTVDGLKECKFMVERSAVQPSQSEDGKSEGAFVAVTRSFAMMFFVSVFSLIM